MNNFKNRFETLLDEEIETMEPSQVSREGDQASYTDSFQDQENMEDFNTLAPEGYAERHKEMVKGWQSKITEFLSWLNGTDESLRTELADLDDQYEGVSKDSEKKIADVAQNLGALNQILVEIPRFINQQTRDEQGEAESAAPTATGSGEQY